jgi:hypothetical protein
LVYRKATDFCILILEIEILIFSSEISLGNLPEVLM